MILKINTIFISFLIAFNLNAMQPDFSLKEGLKKTILDKSTYQIFPVKAFTTTLQQGFPTGKYTKGLDNNPTSLTIAYALYGLEQQYQNKGFCYLATSLSTIPLSLGVTIVRNSFSPAKFNTFSTWVQTLLDHPFLTMETILALSRLVISLNNRSFNTETFGEFFIGGCGILGLGSAFYYNYSYKEWLDLRAIWNQMNDQV